MPIKRKVAEGHLEKVQNTPPTIRLSQDTRHAPAAKQETSTEHKAKPYVYSKKDVAEGHLQKMQDAPPTTRLSQDTEHKALQPTKRTTSPSSDNRPNIHKYITIITLYIKGNVHIYVNIYIYI